MHDERLYQDDTVRDARGRGRLRLTRLHPDEASSASLSADRVALLAGPRAAGTSTAATATLRPRPAAAATAARATSSLLFLRFGHRHPARQHSIHSRHCFVSS